jgi:hypothetical protein
MFVKRKTNMTKWTPVDVELARTGAFVGRSLLLLVGVFKWRGPGLSPSHRLQGETHA